MNKKEKKILLKLKLSKTNNNIFLLNKMNNKLFYNDISEDFLDRIVPYFEEYHWACLILNYIPSKRFIEKYLTFDKGNRKTYDFGTLFIIQDVPDDYYVYFQDDVNDYKLWSFVSFNRRISFLIKYWRELTMESIFNILLSFLYTDNDEVETKVNNVKENTILYITSLLELLNNKK
jgi:hypothetical protein